MATGERLARAIALRDAALKILRERGEVEVGSYSRTTARVDNYEFASWSPRHGQHGVDIWAPNKVLNLMWEDDGSVEIVSFRRGTWEETILNLASEPSATGSMH